MSAVQQSKPAGRSQRWTTAAAEAPRSEGARRPPPQPLRLGFVSRISVNREAEAVSAGRAAAAGAMAAAQIRKAARRLEVARGRAKQVASLATLAGSLGTVAGLYAACAPFEQAWARCAVGLASVLLMAGPLAVTALQTAREGADAEVEAATAAEGAARVTGFARHIGEAVAAASDSMGLSPTALVILNPLLAAVETEAALARERESTALSAAAAPAAARRRVKPSQDRVVVTPADGRKLTARILDLSMTGVALETDLPGVGVGSTVVIGARKALAVRKLARGMAFQFEKSISPADFNTDIVL